MAFIAYSIYDKEYINSIKLSNTNKNETLILNGIYSFNKGAGKVETFNKIDPNYFDLSPSVNQNGGAEYSYNFWVYYNIRDNGSKEIITGEGKKYIILFYKGDLNILPYNQSGYSRDTDGLKKYLIVKNPLVKISNDGADIIVEYNNINHPDTFNSSSKMVTIVMQENPEQEDELFVNRTNCKVYFNSTLISDRSTLNTDLGSDANASIYSTVMKKNQGNLYINPNKKLTEMGLSTDHYVSTDITEITETDDITKDVPLKIANLGYYNYALSPDEILKLYKKKFPLKEVDIAKDIIKPNNVRIGDKVNFNMYEGQEDRTIPVKSI